MIRFPFASYLFGVGLIASFQLSASPPNGIPGALLDKVETLQNSVDTLQSSVDNLQATIDSLEVSGPSMVPFRTTINGGLCDSNDASTSNPTLTIDGDLEDASFVVTSILIQTSSFTEPNRIFTVNSVTVDGSLFSTSTKKIFSTFFETGSPSSGQTPPGFDIMGLRLAEVNGLGDDHEGGVFPTQIAAASDGSDDIQLRFFCRSDETDWYISQISVSGMKLEDDTISVAYGPGN